MKRRHSRDAPRSDRSATDQYLDSYHRSLTRHLQLYEKAGRRLMKKGVNKEDHVKFMYHSQVMQTMLSRGEPLSQEEKNSLFHTLSSLTREPGGRK